jgi:SAM-dependent methyltransferase
MSPEIHQAFERVFALHTITGPILEVGSISGPESLLTLKSLRQASPKIGINLDPPVEEQDYRIIQGNANDMHQFEDGYFSAVMCNSTLEHDRYFWKTLSEISRVTASGGLIVIGVPGYAEMGVTTFASGKSWLKKILAKVAQFTKSDILLAGSVTLGIHNYPGDYYRFSEQTVREVFLAGLEIIAIHRVMHPPRFIGVAKKP